MKSYTLLALLSTYDKTHVTVSLMIYRGSYSLKRITMMKCMILLKTTPCSTFLYKTCLKMIIFLSDFLDLVSSSVRVEV